MSDLIQRLLDKKSELKDYAETEKERLVYEIITHLPPASISRIKHMIAESKKHLHSNESRKVSGQIVHDDPKKQPALIPIPNLGVELWGRSLLGHKSFLAKSVTDEDGKFEIFYEADISALRGVPDLELKVFDPPQTFLLNGEKLESKNEIETFKVGSVGENYDAGILRLSYYEYDPNYPSFPYCLQNSIRHAFVPEAEAITLKSVAKFGGLMDKIIQENRLNPHKPSYDEIQKAFPETLTISLEKERKGYTRSDEFFGLRMLNGFNPLIFKRDKENPSLYTTAFNGDKFNLTGKIDLPNYKVKFELKNDQLLPVEITLQFRENNSLQANPQLKEPQTYTPADGDKWLQAKRVIRATHLGVIGEVKSHLSQCHFNMEQYAIAFFRHIRKSPLRDFLFPHLKEVVHINKFGRKILMDEKNGFFAKLEPMIIADMLKWVRSNLGTYDWTDWRPRKPLCESHTFAKLGNLYWDILTNYVDSFFAANHGEIVSHWGEILKFSDELVLHSVPYVPLSMEQVDDGDEWYDLNEIQHSSNPRREINGEVKAVRPITSSDKPTEQDIANLKQVCKYLIYQCTFWHSWVHNEHNPEFGELKYGDLLRNGSMGDEDDESLLPEREVAAIILAASNMLTNFTYGYILKNEDGDISEHLIKLVQSKKAEFEKLGFDLNTLRSRLNS